MQQPQSTFQVICLETEAFYALVESVVDRLQADDEHHDKWIDDTEAMSLLRISSTTTLQKLRDEGVIRFTQPKRSLYCIAVIPFSPILENMQKRPSNG